MSLKDVIADLETELKIARRKERKDKGYTRPKYDQSLPKRYRSYLMSANKRGISFELTVAEFEKILTFPCRYCGTINKIGVDRIDSDESYNINNVQPCCAACNWMKISTREGDFLKKITAIYNHSVRPFI